MNFIKLVINELVKNLKKKSTIIFFIFSIIAVIVSFLIVKFKDYTYMSSVFSSKIGIDNYSLKLSIDQNEGKKAKAEGKYKEMYQMVIDEQQKLLDAGAEEVVNTPFKRDIHSKHLEAIKELYNINEEVFKEKYDAQKNKIDRLNYLLYNGTFEEYIEFNKNEIEEKYKEELIDEETYKTQIEEQNTNLRFEIDKYSAKDTQWKKLVLQDNKNIDYKLEERVDYTNNIFIDNEQMEKLQKNKLINNYRLENDIAPYYEDSQYFYNEQGYMRYHYNSFANTSGMIFIGLLIIILSAGTVAEEASKGTIKFLLITPNKRYKVLLAKILSILIILIVSTLIISQISVIIGNIAFGVSTNNYLYVTNGETKVMDTHIYETLQYLLKMPEIIIYMLIGVALSTLIRSVAMPTIISTALYLITPFALMMINGFISIDFLRFLPFRNFDFITQVFPINTYVTVVNGYSTFEPTLTFSINVLIVTAILLLITIFESFNKRDI